MNGWTFSQRHPKQLLRIKILPHGAVFLAITTLLMGGNAYSIYMLSANRSRNRLFLATQISCVLYLAVIIALILLPEYFLLLSAFIDFTLWPMLTLLALSSLDILVRFASLSEARLLNSSELLDSPYTSFME